MTSVQIQAQINFTNSQANLLAIQEANQVSLQAAQAEVQAAYSAFQTAMAVVVPGAQSQAQVIAEKLSKLQTQLTAAQASEAAAALKASPAHIQAPAS